MMRGIILAAIVGALSVAVRSATESEVDSDSVTAKSGSAQTYAVLKRTKFDPRVHKISKVGNDVIMIDGIHVMGTDGEMPRYVLAAATVFNDGEWIRLDVTGCFNPWFNAAPLVRCQRDGSIVRVYALLSDGAGAYAVVWQVRAGQSSREVFSNDEELIAFVHYRIKGER
jgi:hypothetical protein